MTNYNVARVARAAIGAYQQTIGDPRSPDLETAPDWHRESVLAGVETARTVAGPAEQHEAWMRWHLARGWAFGPTRDETARTHPNLRPWAELPPEQQAKDRLFRGVVLALTA